MSASHLALLTFVTGGIGSLTLPVIQNLCSHHTFYGNLFLLCRKMYVRFGAFVDGVDQFDSGAFRLPYAEAAALDPQARILLEQTHVSAHSSVKVL